MADTIDLGCAVRPDGTLKDASEIEWHHDKDDEIPMAGASSSTSFNTVQVAAPSSKGIHSFFEQKTAAAVVVAGSRRSGRTMRPSTRLTDPDNAMNGPRSSSNSVTTRTQNGMTQKRKAASPASSRRVIRRVVNSEDEGEAPITDGEGGDTEALESDAEATAVEFEALQAMADVDHAVSVSAQDYWYTLMSLPPLQAIRGRNVQDSTADLRTIFKGEKQYNNPDNGKIQDGHWCKVCLYVSTL